MSPESFEELIQDLQYASDADQFATSIILARKILAIDPQHALTLIRLGHALSHLANYDEAETVLKEALEYWGVVRREIVFVEFGNHFKFRGDYVTAALWYRKAIALLPEDATCHVFLGAVLAKQGNLKEAESALRTATQCAEGCIDEAFYNLGLVLRGQSRLEESLVCFKKALELDPEYKAAKYSLDDVRTALSIDLIH